MITQVLADLFGLIEPEEGESLRSLASTVSKEHAIIEVGSHTGKSSAYLGVGAREGQGPRVTCVDLWPDWQPEDDVDYWDGRDALQTWTKRMVELDLQETVTHYRGTIQELAKDWSQPVGLYFHDADHRPEAVSEDFLALEKFLVPGGWYACHDYYEGLWDGSKWARTKNHQTAIDDTVIPSGDWTDIQVVGNLWIGRRA